MADQLVTLAQVKARLFPSGFTDTNDDAMITELIEEVSSWVEQATGRKFVTDNAATYTFDTVAGLTLRIPYGIQSVTTLSVNNTSHQPETGGTYTVVPASDFLLRPRVQDGPIGWPFTEIRISRGTLTGTISNFGRIDNGAKVVGNFGFLACPPDVQACVIDGVVAAYASRKTGASAVIGADGTAIAPWSGFFGHGSPQFATLLRYAAPGF